MIRHIRLTRTFLFAAGCLLSLASRSYGQQIIWPTSATTGGNYRIVVVSDGYTIGDMWMYDRAVNNLVLNRLMVDPYYLSQGDKFTIVKLSPAVTVSQKSQFGITPNYDINHCYMDYDEAKTTKLIDNVTAALNPVRVIIVGNYEGVAFGCTDSTWTYISAGAREVDDVLEHEGGHLIGGLFDEFALPDNDTYSTPAVDGPNCSNVYSGTTPVPIWSNFPWPVKPTNHESCRLFQHKIVSPYDDCRMRSANIPFDNVCSDDMTQTLAQYGLKAQSDRSPLPRSEQPPTVIRRVAFQPPAGPASAPTSARSVRLLVRIAKKNVTDTTGATASVAALHELDAPIVHQYYRNGNYVYGIIESTPAGDIVLESGVLPGDPFERRGYSGVSAPHPVDNSKVEAAVLITLPNISRTDLETRKISIRIMKLEPSTGRAPGGGFMPMSPDLLRGYLSGPFLVQLTPDQLRQAALTPP